MRSVIEWHKIEKIESENDFAFITKKIEDYAFVIGDEEATLSN